MFRHAWSRASSHSDQRLAWSISESMKDDSRRLNYDSYKLSDRLKSMAPEQVGG